MELDRYLARIGYSGPKEPTLEVLNRVIAHHTATIPFENLDPFLGVPVELDLASIQEKLVTNGRGGYCFEQNFLLRAALVELGFEAELLGARILWNREVGVLTRISHVLLLVFVEGRKHIVDVGFGGLVMTGSLRLENETSQATPLEPFRLLQEEDGLIAQVRVRERWRSLYHFNLEPHPPIDFEAINWYLSTWPDSKFVNTINMARADQEQRFALNNLRLATHRLGHPSTKRELNSLAEFRATLEETFRINTATVDVERAFALLSEVPARV